MRYQIDKFRRLTFDEYVYTLATAGGREPPQNHSVPAAIKPAAERGNEFDFSTTSSAEIIDSYLQDGCVLLRNFVAPDRLIDLKRTLQSVYEGLQNVHVYGQHLQERGLPDLHEWVLSDRHYDLLDRLFDGFKTKVESTQARRMASSDANPIDGVWQMPLAPHLDAFFHPIRFTLNFWMPLQDCGETSPCLGVVCTDFDDIVDFVGYHDDSPIYLPGPELNFGRFNDLARRMFLGEEDAVSAFRSRYNDRIWIPNYRLGDAMMLSNWTLHFTHARPGMNETRENIELRFVSDKGDGSGYASLRDVLENRGFPSAGIGAFTFAERPPQPIAPIAASMEIADVVPLSPVAVVPLSRSPNGEPEAEHELSAGVLAMGARFPLLVEGSIGVKEVERLIRRLQLDKEILEEIAGEASRETG